MSVKIDGSSQKVKKITFNNQDVKQFKYGGSVVWCKPYSLTINATNCTPYIRNYTTKEPSVESQTDEFTPPSTIYHGDSFSIGAHGVLGYGDVEEQRIVNVSGDKTFTFSAPKNGPAVIPTPSWGVKKPHGEVIERDNGDVYILFPYIPGGRRDFQLFIKAKTDCSVNLRIGRYMVTQYDSKDLTVRAKTYTNIFGKVIEYFICDVYNGSWKPNYQLKLGDNKVEWPTFSDIIASHSQYISIPALVVTKAEYNNIENVHLVFRERDITQAGSWGYNYTNKALTANSEIESRLDLSTAPSTLSNVKYICGVKAKCTTSRGSMYFYKAGEYSKGLYDWAYLPVYIGDNAPYGERIQLSEDLVGIFEDTERSFGLMYHMFYAYSGEKPSNWVIRARGGSNNTITGELIINSYWQ